MVGGLAARHAARIAATGFLAALILGVTAEAHPARAAPGPGCLSGPAVRFAALVSTSIQVSEVEADPVLSGQDSANEWLELRNVGASSVSLTGWTLTDNVSSDAIPTSTLPPGGCLIVAASTSGFASEHPSYVGTPVTVSDGVIGNALANAGDVLTIRDGASVVVDCVSWGSDASCFSPSVPVPPANTSQTIQRSSSVDTDTAADWITAAESPCPPLASVFGSLSARAARRGALLTWRTATELTTLGFHVFRQRGRHRVRLTGTLIPARGGVMGASYRFRDRLAPRRGPVRYWVQAVDRSGARSWIGPARLARP